MTEPVPMSEVQLTLDTDSLLDLPAGASYHAKSGRANLDVRNGEKPGTIVVHASCDSLQRLVDYYERMAGLYKQSYDEAMQATEEEHKQHGCPVRACIIAFLAGVATGIILTILTKKIWKKSLCTASVP